jgi:hypothetical protein
MKTYTLAEMKETYIGIAGTKMYDDCEDELRLALLGRMIQAAQE